MCPSLCPWVVQAGGQSMSIPSMGCVSQSVNSCPLQSIDVKSVSQSMSNPVHGVKSVSQSMSIPVHGLCQSVNQSISIPVHGLCQSVSQSMSIPVHGVGLWQSVSQSLSIPVDGLCQSINPCHVQSMGYGRQSVSPCPVHGLWKSVNQSKSIHGLWQNSQSVNQSLYNHAI